MSTTLWTPRRVALALAVCCAAQLWALWPATAAGSWGCDLSLHLAEASELERGLAAGDLDMWNESANLGFPSGYYYQLLPQLVAAVLGLLFGGLVSFVTIFQATIILPHVLLPLVVYRALRLVDVTPGAALGAAIATTAVAASNTWGLGIDSVLSRGVYTQAWAMLFYPLALAHAWRYLSVGRGLVSATVFALLTGASHPFIAVCLPPALLLAPWWRLPLTRTLRRSLALGGAALAASAFLWLPILVDYQAFGGFPNRGSDEAGLSAGVLLDTFEGGALLDEGRWRVLTALTVAAAVLALLRRGGAATPLLIQGLGFGALVALGPVIGKSRDDLVPAIRFLAPMQLALAAAGGVAAARLAQMIADRAASQRWWTPRRAQIAALAVTAVAALSAAVVIRARVDHHLEPYRLHRAWTGPAFDALSAELARLPRGRVATAEYLGISHRDHWWYYLPAVYGGHPVVRGYGAGSLQSSRSYRYLYSHDDLVLERHARLYDVRYVLAHTQKAPRDAVLLAQSQWFGLYQVDGGGLVEPARIVDRLAPGRDRELAARMWLDGDGPRTLELLLIAGDARRDGARARVLDIRRSPSRIEIDVEVDAADQRVASFLVKESHHPRWHATVDGRGAAVLEVAPAMMAVQAGPGRHTIVLEFERPLWSWLLLLWTVGGLGALAWRGRRQTLTAV